MGNALYYGDNLAVLREHIKDESVDLVYLDPPFNSNANYNVLFKAPDGQSSQAQIEAFEDTWHWNEHAERAFDEVMTSGNSNVADMLRAMRSFLGENDMMAYLAMMAVRLLELHRVLKKTGSLYLHCDPTASHYLKILLDAVFGQEHYMNEIIWKRAFTVKGNSGQGSKFFGVNTDTIFFYAKSSDHHFEQPFGNYSEEYIADFYKYEEPDGRRYRLISMIGPGGAAKGNPEYEVLGVTRFWRYSKKKMQDFIDAGLVIQTNPGTVPVRKQYLDKGKGVAVQNLWDDIPALSAASAERLGYPTQKPVALLERILLASSKEGDLVLDPFCGCGTTVHAAQKLNRQWIGIDVTHLAISLIERRLKDAFKNSEPPLSFEVHGVPKDAGGAADLAKRDKYQFQWWAVSLVDAIPFAGKKKGADGGIDGLIYFKPDGKTTERAIVSVKGGDNINVGMVRDLKGVLEREKAPIGIFISLADVTKPMITEAASAGFYDTGFGKFPRLQILTVQDLFDGKRPQIPFGHSEGYKKAAKEKGGKQEKLL